MEVDCRPMEIGDVPRVVDIHIDAFEGFFLTRLGRSFLARYYELVVEHPEGCAIVGVRGGDLIGFAVGFHDQGAFYSTLKQRKLRFGIAAMKGIVRQPGLVANTVRNYLRTDRQSKKPHDGAELSSLAVTKSAQGGGFGSRLLRRFVSEVSKGPRFRLFVSTDAEGNEAVTAFYLSHGFELLRTETHGSRVLNVYVLDLDG